MRKSDKKVDNQLRISLTDVCEVALKSCDGFEWLTHTVNYNHFPKSLIVICIFDTNDNLTAFLQSKDCDELASLINKKLFEMNVYIKNIAKHIAYDTEENCTKNNNGKWADRLNNTILN